MRVDPDIEKLFEARTARRKELAKLPFHEKIRIVERLRELSRIKSNPTFKITKRSDQSR